MKKTLLLAVFLSACGQKNKPADKPADPPKDKPAATTPDKPASAPAASTQAAAPAASTCRALVDAVVDGKDAVIDVKLGATSTFELGAGSIVVDNNQIYAVQLADFSAKDKNQFGSQERKWQEIVITQIPGGSPKTITKDEPEKYLPEEEGGNNEYSNDRGYSLTSFIGPYLSVNHSDGGYGGGAHDFDSPTYQTLRIPEGIAVPQDVLKTELSDAIAAKIKKDSDTRRASDDIDDEESDLPTPENFASWSYSFQGGDSAAERGAASPKVEHKGLWANHWLDCCSWAENHNLHQLEVPLPKLPSTLQSFLKFSADGGWVEAPDACGSVAIANTLQVKFGKDGAAQDLKQSVVVKGVYWIDAKNPFAVAQLPKPIPATATEAPASTPAK